MQVNRCSGWAFLTTAHTVKGIHLTITSTLFRSVHQFKGFGAGYEKTYQSVWNVTLQPPPLVCLLGSLEDVTAWMNTVHMALPALCIAENTIQMNWKNQNNLNFNQYRDRLTDHISLDTASSAILEQSLWVLWLAPSPSGGGEVMVLSRIC